ncbi:hypothetical protein ACLMJK_005603 [Lecanora helva]
MRFPIVTFLYAFPAIVLAIPATQQSTNALSLPSPASGDISLPPKPSSPVLQITCDANRYGQNLRVPSCQNAAKQILTSDLDMKFADRTGVVSYDISLPYRIQSSDGLCYIQLVLKEGAVSGNTTSTLFGVAAITLIQQCAVKYGYGGSVSQIGGDNNLEVIVSSYKPNVKCNRAPSPPWRSTVTIFAEMTATKNSEIFGPAGRPDVDVSLPFYLKASDNRATVKISSNGGVATSSWYAIWEAVNSIAYMCITRHSKGAGRATKIGTPGNINVEFFDRTPVLSQVNETAENLPAVMGGLVASIDDSGTPVNQAMDPSEVTVIYGNGSVLTLWEPGSAGSVLAGNA